jgi:arginyl-tRNA synthetase
VIDASQSYTQAVVYESLRRLGFDEAADCSEHLAYEKVTLAASAARELGAPVPDGASVVAMTGRGGIQVFADELLDMLGNRVRERTSDGASAEDIAVGAARYYMLKYSNNQRIAFDFEEALRTTGETGVYLQYAYVRASGIARKAGAATSTLAAPDGGLPDLDRALVLAMARYPSALRSAVEERSILVFAKYAFELATAFNAFYDNTTPVVRESSHSLKNWRLHLVKAFRLLLGDVLDVLGIPRLERL